MHPQEQQTEVLNLMLDQAEKTDRKTKMILVLTPLAVAIALVPLGEDSSSATRRQMRRRLPGRPPRLLIGRARPSRSRPRRGLGAMRIAPRHMVDGAVRKRPSLSRWELG